MTDFKNAKGKIRRRVQHQAALGDKTHYYTSIPDPLNQEYIDGNVNDTLFRLIYTLLSHNRDFWITRQYLADRFSEHTLQKYLPLIEKAKIVEIEKRVVTPGAHAANIYHTNHPDDWDMSVIIQKKRVGQKPKAADVQGRKKPIKTNDSQSDKPADVQPADVQPAEVQPAEVQDIISTNANQTNLNDPNTNPQDPEDGQASLPGVKGVTLRDLDGTLKGLYTQYVSIDVIRPIVRSMTEMAEREKVAEFLKVKRSQQYGLMSWNVKDPDWWLAEFSRFLTPPEKEEPTTNESWSSGGYAYASGDIAYEPGMPY